MGRPHQSGRYDMFILDRMSYARRSPLVRKCLADSNSVRGGSLTPGVGLEGTPETKRDILLQEAASDVRK